MSLNMVISGWLKPGDHCIVSSMEHNAVMRPLLQLEGVEYDRIPCDYSFRTQPGTNCEVIKVLPYGTKVVLVSSGDEWTEVTWNGKTGYVYSAYLTAELAGDAAEILAKAAQYLGVAYVYGGTTPAGFDCSGFTQYVFAAGGIKLDRTAHSQISNGVKVSKSELLPGDLVIFKKYASSAQRASHVGLYIGNGKMIHAGNGGIAVTDLDSPYWVRHYQCARRVIVSNLAPTASMPITGMIQRINPFQWNNNSQTIGLGI